MPSRSPADLQRERKRKNADAQAQFRQRRANYISSLEETVTKLEAVVLELQDSLRDAKSELAHAYDEKRQHLTLIEEFRHGGRVREQEWREAWQAKLPNTAIPGNVSTLPSLGSLPGVPMSPRPTYLPPCLDTNLRFGHTLKDRTPFSRHLEEGHPPFTFSAPVRTHNGVVNDIHSPLDPHQSRPPSSSNYSPSTSNQVLFRAPDENNVGVSTISSLPAYRNRASENNFDISNATYADGPTATLPFLPRIPPVFSHTSDLPHPPSHTARSMSPHSPRASPSSAATSGSSQLHYITDMTHNGADNLGSMKVYGGPSPQPSIYTTGIGSHSAGERRPDGVRRSTYPGADILNPLSIHGPSSASSSGILRSITPSTPSEQLGDHGVTMTPIGPSRTRTHPYNADSDAATISERRHQNTTPPVSNTLAVIKAQAFGALRRNRAHKKRGNGYATKVALEALEARGLGLGLEPTTTLSSRAQINDEEVKLDEQSEHDVMEN